MDKVMDYGHWFLSPVKDCWVKTKAGYREINIEPEIELEIDSRDVESLIKALDEQGWIKPRLDERLRTEDLKITHRLLDIIEKSDV